MIKAEEYPNSKLDLKFHFKRFIAVCLDTSIAGLLDIGIVLLVLQYGLNTRLGYWYLTLDSNLRAYAYLLNIIFYFVVLESIFKKTIGKKIMGLQIISTDGGKPKLLQILIRNIFRITDQLLLIGSIIILFSSEQKRLGEILSKTKVVLTKDIKSDALSNQFNE